MKNESRNTTEVGTTDKRDSELQQDFQRRENRFRADSCHGGEGVEWHSTGGEVELCGKQPIRHHHSNHHRQTGLGEEGQAGGAVRRNSGM